MEWRAFTEIVAVAVGVLTLAKNTIVIARFISFVTNLRPTLDQIARNSVFAVEIAQRAEVAALEAKKLTQQQDEVLAYQNKALETIMRRLPPEKAKKD